jgi:integrase
MIKRERPEDRRKTRDRSHDKGRSRLFTELSVTKLHLAKEETEAVYRDKKQAGLLLRISRTGVKSWRCQYYDPTQRKMRSEAIGEFRPGSPSHTSIKDARNKASRFRANKEDILDERAKLKAATKDTFRAVADWYFAEHVEGKRISADQIKRTIEKIYEVDPTWPDRPFEEITRPDVVQLLRKIAKQRGPRAADIALVTLRRMMTKHSIGSKGYSCVIVPGMATIENPKERARDRILTDQEIRALFAVADRLGTFGALAKVCLYTAQRRGKVADMKFSDIEDGVWIIEKAHRREKGTGARLKLPPAALAIIAAQEKLRTCAYVFPSSAMTGFSAFGKATHQLEVLRGALEGIKVPTINSKAYKAFIATPLYKKWHWIIHDLRRTARSLMSRLEIPSDIAERVMGHSIGGVKEVYDRHNYDLQRADALLKLSTLIGEILTPPTKSGGNVVALRR